MFSIENVEESQQNEEGKPLKEWRTKFEAGTLETNEIIKFFRVEASNYFQMRANTEIVRCSAYNETGAKLGIIDVLMGFILGDNPETVLNKIKSEGHSPSVCGKVFKNGEPTYSCRQCGVDSTCVLCVSCFKQSAHKDHKYKMATSGGGGCCDCGDEEAWRQDHYCLEHFRGKQKTFESTIITSRMEERCEIAFRAIVMYSVKYLELESNGSSEEAYEDAAEQDEHCTILYNDEKHTFDQVIQTLTKIVGCAQKDAMELVTRIDREGRAVVKCDSFAACMTLKKLIENQQISLKVTVLHVRAVANQQFAIQLLAWFQEFLTRHFNFRKIFVKIVNDKQAQAYNIGHILQYDWKLWKTARTCWHHLLISSMLMEYENKKILAIQFSRHYSAIIGDFIRDDHDHPFSVVSLSVQLFTVPTIAHYLISHEGIFLKLIHTFYYEFIDKCIRNDVLTFPNDSPNLNSFRRSTYILFDMKYILSFKPNEWTAELRVGFLEGCRIFMKLLNVMQGMEAFSRQINQHMDYEPEWESPFSLQIKLNNVISLILDWCSSDREVLIKVYQMTMRHILDKGFILSESTLKEQKFGDHVANCYMYDVASKPISIHLPLSRFFVGLYLRLSEYGLNFDNVTSMAKRTPEEIIDPILCTQTMIAQVHAGMWRRNGYSLLHQLYFYRNIRCRSEMFDRDIAGMQIGAALIESNQYLIHILSKFNLLEWVCTEHEPTASATDDHFMLQLSMVDELLEFLIVVISERYMPGIANVTDEDRIKKEIIQLLCIKNYSHSELNRSLFSDTNIMQMVLEDVIDTVATFKKPSVSDSKGVYELKTEYYDDYNMYFYHYTKEEKSKSEETQRTRRKNANDLVCCPPPRLPKLANDFVGIANLLQCDVMLSLMKIILTRGLDLKAKTFTDNHLQKILYLIGIGLHEEESQNYPFLTFYERAIKYDILSLLEKLSHSARVEAHRDLIIWVIKKFKGIKSKENVVESMDSEESNPPLTTAEAERHKKEERSKLAAERRALIMAQMANAQKSFINSNSEMFAAEYLASTSNGDSMDWTKDEKVVTAVKTTVCLGVNRSFQQPEEQKFKCILCFENCTVSCNGPCLVYSAFIQKSTILMQPKKLTISLAEPHTSTCGHVMHATCWKEYYDNEVVKVSRRPNRNRHSNSVVNDKKWFLCPYCRCISNAVLPLCPPLSQYSPPILVNDETKENIKFQDCVTFIQKYMAVNNEDAEKLLEDDFIPSSKFSSLSEFLQENSISQDLCYQILQSVNKSDITDEWKQFTEIFTTSVQRIVPLPYSKGDHEQFLIAWQSCAYTIQSIEMYLRSIDKPFKNEMSIRHSSCLSGLIRVCSLLGALITPEISKKLKYHLLKILETVFAPKQSSCLEWDCFRILTSLIFSMSALIYNDENKLFVPSGTQLEYFFLTLMFLANLTKAILLYQIEDVSSMEVDNPDEFTIDSDNNTDNSFGTESNKNYNWIVTFYKSFNLQYKSNSKLEFTDQNVDKLLEYVQKESQEFLRCSCLLFHFLTDVEFPDQFAETNGDNFYNMCQYLGLSSDIVSYFDPSEEYIGMLNRFADMWNQTTNLEIVPCTRPIRTMITLPEDYSDLINSVSDLTCPKNEREEMKTPTMCLVCNEVLCGQSYCCQPELDGNIVGACTYHAHVCGGGVSVFLRIRDCQVLYLGNNKGCFVQAPYLDEYGETDQGLRRGNPLRLCKERLRKLELLWLGHGVHEEIERLNDGSGSIVNTQWQHI